MTTWRYLTSDSVEAAPGLALDVALMHSYGRDATKASTDATLRLYSYRPHCALVGRYQSLADEVDLDFCAANDVQVGRRPTGGGAIIMGPEQLGVAVTASARPEESPREALKRYAQSVIAGLAKIGVESQFRSKNDLEVGGRKIAGLGLHLDPDGAVLFHASVLFDLNVELMLQVLRIPGAKVMDKAVARVGERVTTLSRELGRGVSATTARSRFAEAMAACAGAELVTSRATSEEQARSIELVETRFGNSDWTYQRSPRRNARGSSILKTPAGLLRIYAGVQGDSISSVLVTGDFNQPPAALPRLEAALKWAHAEPELIRRAVAAHLSAEDLGIHPDRVAEAISEAARRGAHLERAGHPRRLDGSCYFPDPKLAGEKSVDKETKP